MSVPMKNQVKVSEEQHKQIPSLSTALHYSFGFESFKKNNIFYIHDKFHIITSVGNTIQIIDLRDCSYEIIEVKGGGGIGPIRVHDKQLAVAEKGEYPKVYIFNADALPDLIVDKVLEKGTKMQYTAMSYNSAGDRIATVGGDPDFMLTIWDRNTQKIILRTKAFGTDVHNVSFSNSNEGQLTTSGMGHIKFWKMAQTFTGLKLQGQVGKFGKLDISDINGYVELPDGKVLSGSESGNLLLWDGNLIKVVFRRANDKPCHDGGIDVVYIQSINFSNSILESSTLSNENTEVEHTENESMSCQKRYFVTGGKDGRIRFWNFSEIDEAEPSDVSNVIEVDFAKEIIVGEDVNIVSIIPSDNFWIVQDGNGAFYRVTYKSEGDIKVSKLFDFHSGKINGIVASPNDHVAVTIGEDGTVRLVDYLQKKRLYHKRFNAGASYILWNPKEVDPNGLSFTVGFNDGVIRVLKRCDDDFELINVMKPHTESVVCFSYSKDGKTFVTSGKDKILFFFNSDQYKPIGFIKLDSIVTSMIWNVIDDGIIITLMDGRILELQRPDPDHISTDNSFEFKGNFKNYLYHQKLKPLPKPKKEKAKKRTEEEDGDVGDKKEGSNDEGEEEDENKEEEEEEEIDTEIFPVLRAIHSKNQELFVSLKKPSGLYQFSGGWWEDDIHTIPEYPERCLFDYNSICSYLSYSALNNYLILGFDDGKVFLMDLMDSSKIKSTKPLHDSFYGKITGACTSFDESILLSVGEDGCFFVQRIIGTDVRSPIVPDLCMASESVQDITDSSFWSIQEAKNKEKESEKMSDAEKRKNDRKNEIEALRREFLVLLEENEKNDSKVRLSREEMQLDVNMKKLMDEKLKKQMEVVERKKEWENARLEVQLKKLQNHFICNLEVERIELNSFVSGKKVATFRTPKIYHELAGQIDQMHKIINEELGKKQVSISTSPSQQKEHVSDRVEELRNKKEEKSKPRRLSMTRKSSVILMEKAEDIKRNREDRSKMRQLLMSRKPSESEDDQELMSDIIYAQTNMGDYKLKTDPNFVISENQRVTTEKKLRQIILLAESLHVIRMAFNSRVLLLHDLKQRLTEKFETIDSKILEIDRELEQKQHKAGITNISHLEMVEQAMEREKLEYEKKKLQRKKDKQVESFDSAIDDLRKEKFRLEADLKSADLKLLLLYKELEFLREYELRDHQLFTELSKSKKEKAELQMKIFSLEQDLSNRKRDIEKLCRQEKVMTEFLNTVPENHPAYQELYKVFKKSKLKEGDDSDSEESDAESESEDNNEQEEEEEEKIPEGCEPELFEKILKLRRKRLEQEKALESISKSVETITTNRKTLITKESALDKTLRETEAKIEGVQREKQNKLNELETVVILKLGQIHSLVNLKIPADLSNHIVFTNSGITRLSFRIKELQSEMKHLKERNQDLHKVFNTLMKDQKSLEKELSLWTTKVKEVQLLKFGQEVDLEELEDASVDTQTVELTSRLYEEERRAEAELKKWDNKINECKEKLVSFTRYNSSFLQQLSSFRERQQFLENELDLSQTTIIKRVKTFAQKEDTTQKQLQTISMNQTRQIEEAKNEIAVLKSK